MFPAPAMGRATAKNGRLPFGTSRGPLTGSRIERIRAVRSSSLALGLGLGKVIGWRAWGGEIWLSHDTWLVDKGIASAAENGVYGPEGKWLIEGQGVEPDI